MSAVSLQWVCQKLNTLLGVDSTEDIGSYILSIKNKKDLEEYLCDLLDPSVVQQKQFIDDLLRCWDAPESSQGVSAQVYIKTSEELFPAQERPEKRGKKKKSQEVPINLLAQPQQEQYTGSGALPLKEVPYGPPVDKSRSKIKPKFVPLFSDDGQQSSVAAKLPGRHPCECQATKHSLIGNCLSCGRVVCSQEGSGPCLFCGTLVCSKEEREVLDRCSKKSERLREQLMASAVPPLANQQGQADELERATRHKDTLLEYDRTSTKRTQVLDDESDYFSTDNNQWLTTAHREALRKREEELHSSRHAGRSSQKVVIDFAGRRVVRGENPVDIYDVTDEVVQEVHFGKNKPGEPDFNLACNEFFDLINPDSVLDRPIFVANDPAQFTRPRYSVALQADESKPRAPRLQDPALMEMRDDGWCLSLHQPWASFVTAGIKKHEGRSWYSAHRGRLWIASTVQKPSGDDISALEDEYREIYKDPNIVFPDSYPTACLLGCVDIKDVPSQEQYQEQFEGGESTSDGNYVFICENPQELLVKLPNSGKHKIYKLDSNVHLAAKKGLRSALEFSNVVSLSMSYRKD